LLQKDSTTKEGQYFFDLKVNKDYILEFQSNKIPPTTLEFTTKGITKSDTLVIHDVGIEYLSNKEPFIIKNIYYDFDKYKLRPESQKIIDSTLLVILREAPDIIIELSSHTDSKGDDAYNIELSQKRAESVVNYLIKKGIDKNRLVAKGYGETRPIAPNENPDGSDNPEGRQKNRRTEFRIIGNLSQYSEIIYEE
jgi:outer membrane protein OmpA-like peptidoglycan-associated protein